MRRFLVLSTLLCSLTVPALAAALSETLPTCLACHGETGRSETPDVPSLGGQPSAFVLIQLYQFRENQRTAPPMNDMAKGLTDDDLREFSEAIAKLPPPAPPAEAAEASRMEQGRALAEKHRCGFCHNPDFSGHDQIPRLADQREDYLLKALLEYKTGARPGYDPSMVEVAQAIGDSEIPDLAYFLANWR